MARINLNFKGCLQFKLYRECYPKSVHALPEFRLKILNVRVDIHLESWPHGKNVYIHGIYMSATSLSDARWQACRWHACIFDNMCRHVCTKSENYKHVTNTYRHGMYIVCYVHVYTMYRHGMYMFMTVSTHLTIHKHVHTMFRHVHTQFGRFVICMSLSIHVKNLLYTSTDISSNAHTVLNCVRTRI